MSEKTSDVKEPLATFKQRALAGLVPDFLVPFLLMVCGGILFGFASDAFMIIAGVVCQLCAILTFIANFIFLPYKRRGQTNGKTRQHITTKKIVNKETWELRELAEGDIGLIIGRAIVNWIEVFFIIPVLIPFLMISSSNNNQTLTDRLFGTVVVQVDPEEFSGKKDEKTTKPIKTEKAASDKTAKTKTTARTEGLAKNNLAMISKIVFIGGSVIPIFYFFLMFLRSLLVTISFSINVWGGFSPFTGALIGQATRGFAIVSYLCFFLIAAALFLLALQYSDKLRINLFIAGGLFVAFIVFWIITYHTSWNYVPFTYVNGNLVQIQVGHIVVWLLAMIALITSLFFVNKSIKQVNEEHRQEIPTYKGHIALIIFASLRFINFIIGVAAVPQFAFGAVIYYLGKLIVWCFVFTMIAITVGTIFKAIKLDTSKIPINE
ncbi:MAG: hypothetical protein KAX09_01460 [Candidatus Heimdallarchaeota archaeon]|nr:hypothetical protein [Candidatus Heimdallarchaeota archaeon]MCK4289627.1 hypothetical protein [Candidatus Heimdallarchaeota archaeon]